MISHHEYIQDWSHDTLYHLFIYLFLFFGGDEGVDKTWHVVVPKKVEKKKKKKKRLCNSVMTALVDLNKWCELYKYIELT